MGNKVKAFFGDPLVVGTFPFSVLYAVMCTQHFGIREGKIYYYRSIFDKEGKIRKEE